MNRLDLVDTLQLTQFAKDQNKSDLQSNCSANSKYFNIINILRIFKEYIRTLHHMIARIHNV